MTILDNNLVYKSIVILAIEKTLLVVGKPTYDKVVDLLEKDHHCDLADCYAHPEYLTQVLKKLYGNSYLVIIESINKKLEEYSYKEPIKKFQEVLGQ